MVEVGMFYFGYDYIVCLILYVFIIGFGYFFKGIFVFFLFRDLKEFRYIDMFGFEDFGFGSVSVSRRVSGVNVGKK